MNEEQLRTTKKQKSMMNNNKFYLTVLTVATLVLATACSENGFVQEKTSEANNGNVEQPLVTFTGAYTDKQTEPPQQRRTSLSHQVGSGAVVYWSAGDKIWVKDNGGTFSQSSTGELRDDNKTGIFQLNGTYTGDTHEVRYTGLNATNANQVTIAAVQNQTVFNNAGHIGTSGDCGTATAIKQANGNYKFKLEHKASYLCLLPRTANNYVKRSKLFKVEITSEDNIAGVYDFSTGRLSSTPVSNASKTVTVNLGNGGAAVSNATTNISSALYAVIAPGTHNMRIRYWLRNTTDNPGGTIEGTVTKYITLTCEEGKIHDITANLNPTNYDGGSYYTWDALQNYWYQHEWNSSSVWQPSLSGTRNPNYPKSTDANRWYNKTTSTTMVNATRSCKSCPNINEAVWYGQKGDPRWDADELWSIMGHLYKGGAWLKKKAYISGFNSNTAPDGRDWRKGDYQYNGTIGQGLPAINAINNYFYLPATGHYDNDLFTALPTVGYYWTSSAITTNMTRAYRFAFTNAGVLNVYSHLRARGFRVQSFQ